MVRLANVEPQRKPGVELIAGLQLGQDRWRYPENLPRVAATGGPQCTYLPDVPFQKYPPFVIADVGANPWQHRRARHPAQRRRAQGIPLRPSGRATAQHRSDRPAGMTRIAIKFTVFVTVMAIMTAALFAVFSQFRSGTVSDYRAVFNDVAGLKAGDSVRVSGIRVGTVVDVALRQDKTVAVDFDADQTIVLTTGTRASVRYLNLIGDRYLELTDSPGSTAMLPRGAEIPPDRTAPALDLDLLLNGLKPVIRGLNPQDVNALTSSLIEILQGQGGTTQSLFSKTASFSNTLADNGEVVQQLIDNLNQAVATLVDRRRQTLDDHRSASPTRCRSRRRARYRRRRHRLAQQRNICPHRPSRRCAPATGGYRRSARSARAGAGRQKGPARRLTAEGA